MKALVISLILLPSILLAAPSTEPAKSDGKKKLAKSGVLSMSGSAGYGSYKLPSAWGETENTEGTNAPLSGSVSKMGPKLWKARVTNASKDDQYSLSARVIQLNLKGEKVRIDSFNATVKPAESSERTYSAHPNATTAVLELSSWKKKSLAKPKASGSPSPAIAATGGAGPGGPVPPKPVR